MNIGFKDWLIVVKNYQEKSASDVISRINRIKNLINLSDLLDERAILILNENENFKRLSISVQSQLRRSLKLLQEYNSKY